MREPTSGVEPDRTRVQGGPLAASCVGVGVGVGMGMGVDRERGSSGRNRTFEVTG